MNKPKFTDKYEQICKITKWMKDYLENAHAEGYIIGLSGGVDSAVVAALAVRAVGASNVHGVIMPIASVPADERDAIIVAKYLGINYDVVDLSLAFQTMMQKFPDKYDFVDERTTASNVKARLRMTMLYQFAGEFSCLVAGTGNRSEDTVGYFTKYGDGGVDILPIAEFYKWEIREMAIALDLPEHIAFRVSTAGLFDGQTDEEDLGMTYEELDHILMFLDGKVDVLEVSKERVKYVLDLVKKNEHKTKYPPIYKRD